MHNLFFEYKEQRLQRYKDISWDYWNEQYNLLLAATELEFEISNVTTRSGGRVYIQGNDGSPFETLLWKNLLPNITKLEIEKNEIIPGTYEYIFKPIVEFQNTLLPTVSPTVPTTDGIIGTNSIYFGSPGTGKSYAVSKQTDGTEVYKITFHPEYDYFSFVGGYKPAMNGSDIEYKFVPQPFLNAYINAWDNLESTAPTKQFYLQIEEINRGNCAEIFGDLFQLLDRDVNGCSQDSINASEELKDYLIERFEETHPAIVGGKIKLPSNLSLIATMNTSDQSLFPMDSAFKRRWDWEYVQINYSCDKSDFIINLDNDISYEWLEFLKKINIKILSATHSQDKQIGNWFVNPKIDKIIDQRTFINKVLFYLWNDVFKDEEETIFITDDGDITFENFFPSDSNSAILIQNILKKHLDLDPILVTPTTIPEETEELKRVNESIY